MIRNILSILIVLCVRCHSFSPRTLLSNSNSFHNKQLHQLYKSQYNGFHHRRGRQKVVEHISSVASVSDGRVYEVTRRRDIKDRLQQSIIQLVSWWKKLKHSAMAEKIKVLRKKLQLMILSSFLCLSLGFGRVSKVRAQSVVGAESTVSSAMQTKTRNAAVTEREPSRKQFAERGVAHVEIEVSKNAADKTSHIEEIFMESMIASHSSPAAALSVEQGGVGKSRGGATAGSESSAKNDRGFKSSSNSNSRNQKNSAFGVVELKEAEKEVKESLYGLADFMKGAKLDTLIMLIVTSTVIPVFKRLNLSPILGFLLMGTVLGPSCLHMIHDVHTIDMLGELGIVFFLFEMGLELSVARLNAMKKDVFGLGTAQFLVTAAAGSFISAACGLSTAAAVTVGGSLALSSSAFVLQLLKDKDAMGTRYGKASFGILLLQDLAVVPLLVVVELLAKGGTGLGKALAIAGVKALFTLSVMGAAGKKLLDPIFYYVAKSRSHEAFLSIILSTVLLMSFVTQGIGLSNTLGAFLAGLLLAETKYRYQIEADIAPFRGLLLGFFFITVGFNIDLAMIVKEAPKISAMLATLIAGKAAIIAALSLAFGMSFANAQESGLLLAQGGEFAFVALGIAERSGLIEPQLCKLLLTTVALSMAATPLLAETGSRISKKIEKERGLTHYMGQDSDAEEMKSESEDFVLVAGYGRVGKMVCDMLDRLPVRYIALDSSPVKAIEARGKGLPVFYGDINRPEVLRNFDVGAARACVFAIDDMTAINKAVINVRKLYPDLPLLIKAKNVQHKERLETMFDNLYVMSPVFQRDSLLLTLPFGGAVLRSLGMSQPEVEAIMDDFRRVADDDKNFTDDTFNFLNSYGERTASIAIVPEKKEKDRERDLERDKDKHDMMKKMERDVSWDGTEEQERQEEEQEMHEYSRISRILYERSYQKDAPKKSSMNGMIGGQEEREVELTDSPVAVYLDGPDAQSASSAVAPVVDEVPERIVPAQNLR